MEDDLLVLIEEYGAGAVGGHLRAAQPRPQVLIGLLKIVSLKGQCNEIFDPLLFGFKKLYVGPLTTSKNDYATCFASYSDTQISKNILKRNEKFAKLFQPFVIVIRGPDRVLSKKRGPKIS